ncbi:MAG: DUF58 domain-containing protein [Pseudomonadota bacterium]
MSQSPDSAVTGGFKGRFSEAFNRTARLESDGTLTITPRQVYILPTRYGLVFAVMLFAMLIGSHNYGVNMGFMLTFLLAGLGMSALLQTWRNLVGLQLRVLPGEPVHAESPSVLSITLINNRRTPRSAIQVRLQTDAAWADLSASGSETIHVPYQPADRGWFSPGRLTCYTFFPFGLFYAWAYFNTDKKYLIYPRLDDFPAETTQRASDELPRGRPQTGDEDFYGHRNYQEGDQPNRIDWKAFARGRGLLAKQYHQEHDEDLWLEWGSLSDYGIEQRLSMMARAVVEFDRAGLRYGLRIPGETIKPDFGNRHRHRCLKALALFLET